MRAHLTHKLVGDGKGKLPDHILTPIFLADPSHQIKVMSSPFFKLAQGETKDPQRCKKIDAMRLKKYIGCWIYQNNHLPIDEFMAKSKAPVEHLFNCHEWCDAEWCWAKQLDEKQVELTNRNMKEMHDVLNYDSDSNSSSSSWETVSSHDSNDSIPTLVDRSGKKINVIDTLPSDINTNEKMSKSMVSPDEESEGMDATWVPIDDVDQSEDDTDSEGYDGLDADELKECSFFAKYNETYDCDEMMFTVDDLEEMKTRERVMMERTERGYYRSKTDHEQLYLQIMDEYARFITRPMLLMLNHPYSTQKTKQ